MTLAAARDAAPERRPCVLVFAGTDPSGGAGVYADVQAIAAVGAHALPVVTVVTVQDNDRVHALEALPAAQVRAQAAALIAAIPVAAVKIGIVGSRANADCIANLLAQLKQRQPDLPVVLDPVLASGHGDALTREDAIGLLTPLLAHATLITPNLPEAVRLCGGTTDLTEQAAMLIARGARHVLIKGGHGDGGEVVNRWFARDGRRRDWHWPRLDGAFHGSGCTLASAIAGLLACGDDMEDAIGAAQMYCHRALATAFAVAPGQRIPNRSIPFAKDNA